MLGPHEEYLMAFGIRACQISNVQVFGSGGGGGPVGGPFTPAPSHSSIVLARAIDGIPVPESVAYATLNDQDESTRESVYWPAAPTSNLVAGAEDAFADRLADHGSSARQRTRQSCQQNTIWPTKTRSAFITRHVLLGIQAAQVLLPRRDTQTTGHMPVSFDANGAEIVFSWN